MPPKPSILWKQIPARLESLLLRLLAKNPEERATLAEVRATLAALKPLVTPALDRVDAAPLPPRPPSRRRHALRLGAGRGDVRGAGHRQLPAAKLRAERLRHLGRRAGGDRGPGPGRADGGRSRGGAATAFSVGDANDSTAFDPPGGASRRAVIAADGNYLLDPFTR